MHAYENEWFKSDESYSHTSERDSLDENALNNEEMMNDANTNQRSEDKPYYIEPRISTISRCVLIKKKNLKNYVKNIQLFHMLFFFFCILVAKVSISRMTLAELHQCTRDTTRS